jgi:hypothetical protein
VAIDPCRSSAAKFCCGATPPPLVDVLGLQEPVSEESQ